MHSAPLRLPTLLGCTLALLLAGCGGDTPPAASAAPSAAPTIASDPTPAEERPKVIVLGDSLAAGQGLAASQAFPALIADALAEAGTPIDLVNAGQSGDTTAGGLRRLNWLLSQEPDLLIVELGANDGLRGQPVEETESNLRQIVQQAKAAGVRVLLLGMLVPPNFGPEYSEQFAAIYPRLAEEEEVPLMPFLLADVGGVAELNQEDGIHPTAEGHVIIARNVRPFVVEALADL